MIPVLPYSDRLDIGALSRLFSDTTNSYKYLFFLSFLQVLKERNFKVHTEIALADLEAEMLVTAWYPHIYFKLSLGNQDQIASVLKSIRSGIEDRDAVTVQRRTSLREVIKEEGNVLNFGLLRFVPFRILRPFFQRETKGLKDHRVNNRLAELASTHFDTHRPLYRFSESRAEIVVHRDWLAYFERHCDILPGWAAWHWAHYMQDRNPSVPGIPHKLFPLIKRNPLTEQRRFWSRILQEADIRCIYTDQKIETSYHLDHFLPWKFVAHDQLWNLIPVAADANNAKRDQLPAESYLDGLAEMQYKALKIASSLLSDRQWNQTIEPYLSNLHLDAESLLNRDVLRNAYRRTLKPLMSIAEQQGFQSEWTYQSARLKR